MYIHMQVPIPLRDTTFNIHESNPPAFITIISLGHVVKISYDQSSHVNTPPPSPPAQGGTCVNVLTLYRALSSRYIIYKYTYSAMGGTYVLFTVNSAQGTVYKYMYLHTPLRVVYITCELSSGYILYINPLRVVLYIHNDKSAEGGICVN